MKLSHLKVSTLLMLGFGIAVLLGLAIAITGAVNMARLSDKVEELANDRMPKVDKFTDFKDNLNTIARTARNIIILADPAARAAEKKTISDTRAANNQLLADLDKLLVLPEGRAQLKLIADTRIAYNAALDRAMALGEEGKIAEAGALLIGEVRAAQRILFDAVEKSTDMQAAIAKDLSRQSESLAESSGALMLAGAMAMAAVGGLVCWLLARSLGRALGAEPSELSAAVQRVADGDLATPVQVRPHDEVSTMAAVARMHRSLVDIVQTVRGNSDSVATASAQIAQGNMDLSSRTEEQASALEQTAASMEELGATVRQNADNAKQADQLAKGASTVAIQGGEVVSQVVATMRDINASSKKIVDIISVIDGIAFQTNILALNAAVEAARAGEQGRGFAVVASEVRSLAQRSAAAAKEIKALINASVERVDHGTALVDQAGGTMNEVVSAIRRVTDIMGEISAASSEQSSGVAQVGEAVGQMDRATQQNAALVEESAAAAESLKHQAQALVQAVAVFRLSTSATARVTSAATAPAKTTAKIPAKPTAAAKSPATSSAKPAVRPPAPPPTLASAEGGDWASF